ETIRGLSDEFESQIDVNDEGQVLIYSANGEQGEALAERITTMTKDVAVGDEFPTAKVVKTTTFGAFVELAKGTDGLLHISNLVPGGRAESVEAVVHRGDALAVPGVEAVEAVGNRGDELAVRVVEVDPGRGRIGLRLANDPEVEGKTAEELAS